MPRNILTTRQLLRIGIALLLVVAGLVGWGVGAEKLLSWEIHRAQRYCEQLVPQLEAYRAQQGSYPERIDVIFPTTARKLPRLLRINDFYYSDGRQFRFQLYRLTGWGIARSGTYWYDSDRRTWFHSS